MTRSIHRSRFGVTSRHTGYSAHADPPELDFNLNGSTTPHDKAPRTSGSHTGSRPDHVRITPEHVRITYHTGPDHTGSRRWITVHVRNTPEHTGSRPDHVRITPGSHWITDQLRITYECSPQAHPESRINSGSGPGITSGLSLSVLFSLPVPPLPFCWRNRVSNNPVGFIHPG